MTQHSQSAHSKILNELDINFDLDKLAKFLKSIANEGPVTKNSNISNFDHLLPLHPTIWDPLLKFGEDIVENYWKIVNVANGGDISSKNINYVAGKLIEVGRPIAAFNLASQFEFDFEPKFWFDLYLEILKTSNLEGDVPRSRILEKILKILDHIPEASDKAIASLELKTFPEFSNTGFRGKYRVTAWHKQMIKDPKYLINLLTWLYESNDDKVDMQTSNLSDEELIRRAKFAHELLDDWVLLPGTDAKGQIDSEKFRNWVKEAYELADEFGKQGGLDKHLGLLFSNFLHQESKDEWLPEVVLELLNQKCSEQLRYEFCKAEFYSRGTSLRGVFDGGKQDLQFASKFSKLATKYKSKFYNFSKVLKKIERFYKRKAEREYKHWELEDLWGTV